MHRGRSYASVFLGRTNTFEGEVLRRNPRCAEVAVASTTL
ncbi:Fe3+/spermidine/putrescine ABC transporter ATP-binding protein, partial [Burkholderia multivorans]